MTGVLPSLTSGVPVLNKRDLLLPGLPYYQGACLPRHLEPGQRFTENDVKVPMHSVVTIQRAGVAEFSVKGVS